MRGQRVLWRWVFAASVSIGAGAVVLAGSVGGYSTTSEARAEREPTVEIVAPATRMGVGEGEGVGEGVSIGETEGGDVDRARALNELLTRTLVVETTGGELGEHQGSGVLLGEGLVATAAHVVAGGPRRVRIRLAGASPSPDEGWPASIIAIDLEHDIALLRSEAAPTRAPMALGVAQSGVTAYCAGAPSEVETRFVRTRGEITPWGDGPFDEAPRIAASCVVGPGMSGGPMLDADGNLLGVIVEMTANGAAAVPGRFLPALYMPSATPWFAEPRIIAQRVAPGAPGWLDEFSERVVHIDGGYGNRTFGLRLTTTLIAVSSTLAGRVPSVTTESGEVDITDLLDAGGGLGLGHVEGLAPVASLLGLPSRVAGTGLAVQLVSPRDGFVTRDVVLAMVGGVRVDAHLTPRAPVRPPGPAGTRRCGLRDSLFHAQHPPVDLVEAIQLDADATLGTPVLDEAGAMVGLVVGRGRVAYAIPWTAIVRAAER